MLIATIILTLTIVVALANAVWSGGEGLIARRPYNNRYNDASGAREDHLG